MIRAAVIVVALLAAGSVSAQQQQSPSEQALGAKLMQELQAGLSCSATLIAAQAELAKAQARIKELESKTVEK